MQPFLLSSIFTSKHPSSFVSSVRQDDLSNDLSVASSMIGHTDYVQFNGVQIGFFFGPGDEAIVYVVRFYNVAIDVI